MLCVALSLQRFSQILWHNQAVSGHYNSILHSKFFGVWKVLAGQYRRVLSVFWPADCDCLHKSLHFRIILRTCAEFLNLLVFHSSEYGGVRSRFLLLSTRRGFSLSASVSWERQFECYCHQCQGLCGLADYSLHSFHNNDLLSWRSEDRNRPLLHESLQRCTISAGSATLVLVPVYSVVWTHLL